MLSMNGAPAYTFGYFRLLPEERVLLGGGKPIKLGGRAFDVLVALVASSGKMLGKRELIEVAWPRLVVEENNLNVQVLALRKVLGHAAIATVPGRGFRFAIPVEVEGDASVAAAERTTRPMSARPSRHPRTFQRARRRSSDARTTSQRLPRCCLVIGW